MTAPLVPLPGTDHAFVAFEATDYEPEERSDGAYITHRDRVVDDALAQGWHWRDRSMQARDSLGNLVTIEFFSREPHLD